MGILNFALGGLFDVLLSPFRTLPWWVGLTVVSLATAIVMLLVFKATSNQDGLAAVKRKIHACLFEIRLFNDDLRAIFRAQFEILRHNLTYLRLSIVPVLWIIVPLVLVIGQLQYHYGYTGLEPGQTSLVTVRFKDSWSGAEASPKPDVTLRVPQGLRVETPGVWVASLREMAWRIGAESWGDYDIEVLVGGESYDKRARVTPAVVRRSPVRPSPGLLDQILYPAESPLPSDSPIESISIGYTEDPMFLFVPMWMWVFFLLSIVFAFLLRKRFGVTI